MTYRVSNRGEQPDRYSCHPPHWAKGAHVWTSEQRMVLPLLWKNNAKPSSSTGFCLIICLKSQMCNLSTLFKNVFDLHGNYFPKSEDGFTLVCEGKLTVSVKEGQTSVLGLVAQGLVQVCSQVVPGLEIPHLTGKLALVFDKWRKQWHFRMHHSKHAYHAFWQKNLCKSSKGREKLWLQMNKQGGLLQEQVMELGCNPDPSCSITELWALVCWNLSHASHSRNGNLGPPFYKSGSKMCLMVCS